MRPPGPGFVEVLKNLGGLRHRPLSVWGLWQERYGDLFELKVPGPPVVFLFRPDWIRTLLRDHQDKLSRETPSNEVLKLIQGDGLSTRSGESWRARRRLFQGEFHKQKVAGFAPEIERVLADFVAAAIASGQAGATPDLRREMFRLSTTLGTRILVEDARLEDLPQLEVWTQGMLEFLNARVQDPTPWPFWLPLPSHLRFRDLRAKFRSKIEAWIEARQEGPPRGDFLGRLLELAKGTEGLSPEEIRDELITFAGAGQDTTAQTLIFTLTLLEAHPSWKQQLLEAFATDSPEAEALLHGVLSEALRLRPPIYAFARRLEEDLAFQGFELKAGSLLVSSVFHAQRHPDFFGRPLEFDPQRPEWSQDPEGFLAFGFGPHRCIGEALARFDLPLLLRGILGELDWDWLGPKDPGLLAGLSLRPCEALPIRWRARKTLEPKE